MSNNEGYWPAFFMLVLVGLATLITVVGIIYSAIVYNNVF